MKEEIDMLFGWDRRNAKLIHAISTLDSVPVLVSQAAECLTTGNMIVRAGAGTQDYGQKMKTLKPGKPACSNLLIQFKCKPIFRGQFVESHWRRPGCRVFKLERRT